MGVFNIDFDVLDYKDILPDVQEYWKDDDVINLNEGDIDRCVWKIEEDPKILTPDYIRREVRRTLKTGVWVVIKGMTLWIPPNYYFFLRRFNTGGVRPDFRLNRLISVYEKIRVRKNPRALGTYTIKSRQIGETTFEMSDCLWEAANMDFGLLGVQSKTLKTVKQSCWRTLIMGWNGIDKWLKDAIYSEFVSGENTAETMKFIKQADDVGKGKNVMIAYAAGSHNAFDSVNNMRRCILDEWNKWEEASPYSTFLNYEKFIATGTSRKGLFSIFSSPADMETRYVKECYDFWQGSDPTKLNESGTTETRIFRQYTSPLTGIEGFYDKWGDATDSNKIYEFIMAKRKSVPKEYRQAEIRAYPLSEQEMFGTFDAASVWSNSAGIAERKVYLMNTRFKEGTSKEPSRLYGNLEWRGGERDSEVDFRVADKDHFDVIDARFSVSFMPPKNREPLKRNFNGGLVIPKISTSCLGIDPIDKRHASPGTRGFSNAAMVNWKFADVEDDGFTKCPTLLYSCRPSHSEIFFEDAIKAAVFCRSLVQTESVNSKIIDYFEDRNYLDWMLAKRGQPRNSNIKGDSPGGGKNIFLTEIMMLIDNITNTPLTPDEPYLLEKFYHPEILEQLLTFNPKDTHTADLVMALGQSLMGSIKILNKKIRTKSSFYDATFSYLLT